MIYNLDFYFVVINAMLFILIWLVQLIIYPSFAYCDHEQFVMWHNRYTGLISLFVVPLMFAQVFLALCMLHNTWNYVILGLIVGVWLTTFLLSVPCHNSLHNNGYDQEVIRKLVLTNWPRTIMWTMCLGLHFWQLSKK
ncbi:hypothetical protein [Candidatus Uabimicrobium amorphum]|uniref:DUF1772 domain-containing protein n=1 Tax=Uabimicrobium amorphum TaxID=2596890 RepID=A0A5S9IKG8_UABAM|nr:hypothetical protein [Candidatus Uabimicrobium amorphum]BBM82710.1 hypothetical protein UABAM_01053 [Candidatus Uabimicrobium amorphum]